jgi:hypothetical protein
MKKIIALVLLLPLLPACSTIKAITYIPPKDAPKFIRTINYDSVDHRPRRPSRLDPKTGNIISPRLNKGGWIPTYSIGMPVVGP